MENNTKTHTQLTDAELFRTWFVMLPVDQAREFQEIIKTKLGWSSAVWYDRTRGRSEFTNAEKALIPTLVGQNPFQRLEADND